MCSCLVFAETLCFIDKKLQRTNSRADFLVLNYTRVHGATAILPHIQAFLLHLCGSEWNIIDSHQLLWPLPWSSGDMGCWYKNTIKKDTVSSISCHGDVRFPYSVATKSSVDTGVSITGGSWASLWKSHCQECMDRIPLNTFFFVHDKNTQTEPDCCWIPLET